MTAKEFEAAVLERSIGEIRRHVPDLMAKPKADIVAAIARELNVDPSTVFNWLSRAGRVRIAHDSFNLWVEYMQRIGAKRYAREMFQKLSSNPLGYRLVEEDVHDDTR